MRVVPRPSVNTWHVRVPSAFGLAAHSLPRPPCGPAYRRRPTMALRWVPTQLSGASRPRFALPGSADENIKRQQLNVFNTIAHYLAHEGIASLRYDKRGCGGEFGSRQ